MSGGGAMSKNKAGSKSSFDQDVWGPQGEALESLYGQVGNLFNQSNMGMQGQIPGATDYMNQIRDQGQAGWQQQQQGGAYANPDLMNQLMGSINASSNQPSNVSQINAMTMGGEGNNYADAMKSQYMQDANKAQEQMLGNLDARASASGMSGGSRHGTATAQGMEDINKNLQSNMANVGYQTFDKDLNRKLGIAQQADQGNLARQQMMQQMLGGQQQAMSGAQNQSSNMQNLGMGAFSPYMAPWQAAGAYSNSIGAPTVLGSGDSSSKSSGKGISGSGGMM
jgi:hypothetical protein